MVRHLSFIFTQFFPEKVLTQEKVYFKIVIKVFDDNIFPVLIPKTNQPFQFFVERPVWNPIQQDKTTTYKEVSGMLKATKN